ncbi:protein AMN1 homolog isoform 2-T2 [Polymixia lowei]
MSSWLNNNEQLDDIDKEFGFPSSLKYCLNTLDSVNQPKLIATDDDMPAHAVGEMQKEVTPPTELEMVRSDEDDVEKLTLASTDTSTQILVPNSTEITDSSDPYYSFKIQVLPPDEAKVVFEQIESGMAKSEKTDRSSENIINVSADDEFAEFIDVKSSEVKSEGNKSGSPIKEFCCITSWMEHILGSNKLLLSKCECKQQTVSKDLVKCFEDEGKAELDPTMEDESKANAGDAQPSISTWTEQATLISDIIDLTGDAEILHSYANVEPNAGSGQSTSTNTRENEIVNLPSSSEGKKHIGHSLIQNSFDSKLTSADKTNVVGSLASPSLGQKNSYSTGPRKRLKAKHKSVGKKQRKLVGPVPFQKKTVKFKAPLDPNLEPALQGISTHINKEFVDADDLISADRTVKLALFGSSHQRKCVLNGCGKSHVSPPENFSGQAPVVISVNLNSKQQSPSETVPMSKCPVKLRIHEEWKNSLVPVKKKQKVHTRKNCTFDSLSDVSPKKAEAICTTNTGKLAVSYNVLPNTFNFKGGHTGTKDSVLDMPDCVDANDKSSKMTVKQPRGATLASS